MATFTVYAIISKTSGKLYIGQSIDLAKRLEQHNSTGDNHIGKFTEQNKGPWELVYSEKYSTRSEALKREKQLKSYRGREFIKNNIKTIRP